MKSSLGSRDSRAAGRRKLFDMASTIGHLVVFKRRAAAAARKAAIALHNLRVDAHPAALVLVRCCGTAYDDYTASCPRWSATRDNVRGGQLFNPRKWLPTWLSLCCLGITAVQVAILTQWQWKPIGMLVPNSSWRRMRVGFFNSECWKCLLAIDASE